MVNTNPPTFTFTPPSVPKQTSRRESLKSFVGAALSLTLLPSVSFASKTQIGPIRNLNDYRQAIALAATRNRFALVDVGAQWCAFCKILDKTILMDPWIERLLEDMGFIRIDVTAWNDESLALMGDLQVQGPPTVFVVDLQVTREVTGTRSLRSFDVSSLADRLRKLAR